MSKILYLAHNEQDYGCYMAFNGLCETLGEENIILYPPKLSYLGLPDGNYFLHNQNKMGFTGTSPYIKARSRMRLYAFDEIIDEMPNIDLIILSSPRHYPVHALRFIKQLYGGKIPRPTAFLDGEDGDNIREDLIEEFHPQFIFKRELTHPIAGIHPLPFSDIVPHLDIYKEIENLPKTIDIFALFGNTHEIRSRIVKFLLEQNYPNSYIGIDKGQLPWQDDKRFSIPPLKGYNEYLTTMASAKINIILRGHGRDTVRYWEAASFETLMLIKDPGIIIPNPYIDKVHCVYFENENDLRDKIELVEQRSHEFSYLKKSSYENAKSNFNWETITNKYSKLFGGSL